MLEVRKKVTAEPLTEEEIGWIKEGITNYKILDIAQTRLSDAPGADH